MSVIYILALDATRQGGAGVYTWTLIENLASRGHCVTLLCHEAADEIKKIAKVIIISRPKSELPFGMWRFSSIFQMYYYWRQFKTLILPKPDVVIGSAQPMILAYFHLYPFHRLIYLPHSFIAPVEIDSYSYSNWFQKKIAISTYRFMERRCLKISKITLRFTENACNAFKKYYGNFCAEKLVTLPMPIKENLATPTPRTEHPFRLLSVGRLIKSKNIAFLINILKDRKDKDWTLDIVGSGGEMGELQAHCSAAGLDDRVAFHGHVDNVDPFYKAADLFVFPSLLENSPVVLLEAMSYSLATLSFFPDDKKYIGSNHEIICHGSTGLLANDDQVFEKILIDIMDGKKDISRLGAHAKKYVGEKHGWDSHIKELEKMIVKIGE